MVEEGDRAPDFTLPGIADDTTTTLTLRDVTERDRALLLLFFPFDFSPVCTNELCAIGDARWFTIEPALDVWAVSGDSVYAHRAFADEYGFDFPLLSDSSGQVADAYGVCYDEWEDQERVPKRAVFLVGSDRTVRYTWQTDNAYFKPDFLPISEAVDELAANHDDVDPDDVDLTVEYGDGPGQVQ